MTKEDFNDRERLIAFRRHFHRHPELSWKEYETQKFIIGKLEEVHIPYVKAAGTGVIAVIRGRNCEKPGNTKKKVLGIRADIDALPVDELSGCDFSSENPHISHACGHDCHAAILLETALRLAAVRDELKMEVRLIFQPSEECIEDSGAAHLFNEELVRSCSRMIGLHIWSKIEAGYASLRYGAVTASTDTFDIEIRGKGGHGAMPHQAADLVAAGVHLVDEIYRANSREIHPLLPHVISVTAFLAGTTHNVIPDSAVIMGTARAFDRKIREGYPKILDRLAKGVGEATRTDISVAYNYGPPPTENDAAAVETGLRAAGKVFGKDHLIEFEPQMIGEDFACYRNEKCFLFLGGGLAEEEKRYPQHSPYFEIDEKALELGVRYFLEYVREYSDEAGS